MIIIKTAPTMSKTHKSIQSRKGQKPMLVNAAKDLETSSVYYILVRVRINCRPARNGITPQKTSKNQKGMKMLVRVKYTGNSLNTTKTAERGASSVQGNGVENPKGLVLRIVSSVGSLFELDIAFAVFIPLPVCV